MHKNGNNKNPLKKQSPIRKDRLAVTKNESIAKQKEKYRNRAYKLLTVSVRLLRKAAS